jgi:uncharacterized membrane protein YGL010W
MKDLQQWFFEYGGSHQNKINVSIHNVAVPAIVVSIVGLLWALPSPWPRSFFNWSFLLVGLALLFYFRLSIPLAVGMLIFTLIILASFFWLTNILGISIWPSMVAIFVVSWVLQFIGHHIEGKRPSFLQDVQFLLIGPLWILVKVYRRFNIKF